MIKITIKWGTDKEETKTYTFENKEQAKFFMDGVVLPHPIYNPKSIKSPKNGILPNRGGFGQKLSKNVLRGLWTIYFL